MLPALSGPLRALSTTKKALRLRRRRAIFFGNDAFSLAHLQTLHQLLMAETELLASLCVTTSSSRTPVFEFARANGLRTHLWSEMQPSFVGEYDFGILASFGHLLPAWLLNELHVLNIHPSLLPRWRGSAPVVHSVLRGDARSGVSIMLLEPFYFDRGPILLQEALDVPEGVRAFGLTAQLAALGQRLLTNALSNLSQVLMRRTSQSDEGARLARKITASDGVLDWEAMSPGQVDRLDRSVGDLMPLASRFGGQVVGVKDFVSPREVECLQSLVRLPPAAAPGSVFFDKRHNQLLFVKCRQHPQEWTAFRRVRIGRSSTSQRWLSALDFYNGYLAKPNYREVGFESMPNPLFKKRRADKHQKQQAVEA